MLDDRDYMRQPGYRSELTLTAKLTILLAVVFALQCINDTYLHTPAEQYLALTTEGFRHGWLWQLITFQFLHFNLMHLLGNLLGFWWIGHFVEQALGQKRFLIALLGCGVMGGLLQGTLMVLFPNSGYGSAMVGASAGVSGLLAIFVLMQKDSVIQLYGIVPIPAMAVLWIWGGISLFFTLVPKSGGGMAHAAHLGGLLAGIAWVKLGWHEDYVQLPWESWLKRFKQHQPRPSVIRPTPKFKTAPPADLPVADESAEVDAVLDKISASGINSLSARERAILEAARKKMAQR